MKIKTELLKAFIKERKMTVQDLANEMEVSVTEIEKLLNGERAGERTAQLFILYFGFEKSRELIDWQAIDKKDPFSEG